MPKSLDVCIISQPVPFWPSLTHIEPEMEACLFDLFPKTKKISIDRIQKAPTAPNSIWIFLPSSTQSLTLSVVKKKFSNPYDRPKSVFFLNGEGSKLAFILNQFQNDFRHDDLFFVACESEKKAVLEWTRGLAERLFVCPYPVNPNWFNTKKPKRSRKSFQLSNQKKLLLYSGRLSEQKNILILLDFVASQKDYDLVLAGDIDSLGFPHLGTHERRHFPFEVAKKILDLKISDRVHFLPYQSQHDLSELMKNCDVQISLSTHYGEDFGYSIAQGLSCGLPTILTSWGGHQTWKRLKESVHFIQPVFEKDRKTEELRTTPKLKLPKKFPRKKSIAVSTILRAEFKNIIWSAISKNIASNNRLQISSEVTSYWNLQRQNLRSHMFQSTQEEIYQKVLRFYGGKIRL